MADLEKLSEILEKVKTAYEMHLKILSVLDANKGRITLVLKDNYRQSGRVDNINYSATFGTGNVNASISLFDDSNELIKYNTSEIVDVY